MKGNSRASGRGLDNRRPAELVQTKGYTLSPSRSTPTAIIDGAPITYDSTYPSPSSEPNGKDRPKSKRAVQTSRSKFRASVLTPPSMEPHTTLGNVLHPEDRNNNHDLRKKQDQSLEEKKHLPYKKSVQAISQSNVKASIINPPSLEPEVTRDGLPLLGLEDFPDDQDVPDSCEEDTKPAAKVFNPTSSSQRVGASLLVPPPLEPIVSSSFYPRSFAASSGGESNLKTLPPKPPSPSSSLSATEPVMSRCRSPTAHRTMDTIKTADAMSSKSSNAKASRRAAPTSTTSSDSPSRDLGKSRSRSPLPNTNKPGVLKYSSSSYAGSQRVKSLSSKERFPIPPLTDNSIASNSANNTCDNVPADQNNITRSLQAGNGSLAEHNETAKDLLMQNRSKDSLQSREPGAVAISRVRSHDEDYERDEGSSRYFSDLPSGNSVQFYTEATLVPENGGLDPPSYEHIRQQIMGEAIAADVVDTEQQSKRRACYRGVFVLLFLSVVTGLSVGLVLGEKKKPPLPPKRSDSPTTTPSTAPSMAPTVYTIAQCNRFVQVENVTAYVSTFQLVLEDLVSNGIDVPVQKLDICAPQSLSAFELATVFAGYAKPTVTKCLTAQPIIVVVPFLLSIGGKEKYPQCVSNFKIERS